MSIKKKESLILQNFLKPISLKKIEKQNIHTHIYKNIPNRSHFCKDLLHPINPHTI